jgi:hypothetical protein
MSLFVLPLPFVLSSSIFLTPFPVFCSILSSSLEKCPLYVYNGLLSFSPLKIFGNDLLADRNYILKPVPSFIIDKETVVEMMLLWQDPSILI